MDFPANLRYTKEHEWIVVEGAVGTVGITDHAQGELGDVVFVELPKVGRIVKLGESFGSIEAVKAVSDLYSPVTGTVTEINAEVSNSPEIVNKDPYGKGWMVKIRLEKPEELSELLTADGYKALIGK